MSEARKLVWKRVSTYVGTFMAIIAIFGVGYLKMQQDATTKDLKVETAERKASIAEAKADAATEAAHQNCLSTNQVRRDFLTSLDQALARSRLSLTATLASPTATVLQKQTAQHNYDAAKLAVENFHRNADPRKCATPTTTTTVPADTHRTG